MLLFIFTGWLLESAKSKGINPDIDGDPEYFGFSRDDEEKYGYYFLVLVNFPAHAEKIWDVNNA
jgi:hypothetical protein